MKTLNITIINQMMNNFFGGGESEALNIARALRKKGIISDLLSEKHTRKQPPFRKKYYHLVFNLFFFLIPPGFLMI